MDKIAASIAQIAAEALSDTRADLRSPVPGLPPAVMEGLRAWIADQPEPRPTVAEAMRRGLTEWLAGTGYLSAAGQDGSTEP